jgi:hypothetical protein
MRLIGEGIVVSCVLSFLMDGLDTQSQNKSEDGFSLIIRCHKMRFWWQHPLPSFLLGFLVIPGIFQIIIFSWKLIYWSGSEKI